MSWYRTGSVNVTINSNVVAGNSSLWSTNGVKAGDIFTTDYVTLYEIITVTNDGSISLDRNYTGATASTIGYAIIQNMSPYPTTVLNTMNTVGAQYSSLLNSIGTMANQSKSAVQITGGTINGTSLGASTPSSASVTSLTTTGTVAFGSGSVTVNGAVPGSQVAIARAATAGYSPSNMAAGGAQLSLQDATNNTSFVAMLEFNMYTAAGAIGLTYEADGKGSLVFGSSNASGGVIIEHMRLSSVGTLSTTGGIFTSGVTTPNTAISAFYGLAGVVAITNSAAPSGSRYYDFVLDNSGNFQGRVANDAVSSTTDWLTVSGAQGATQVIQLHGNVDVDDTMTVGQRVNMQDGLAVGFTYTAGYNVVDGAVNGCSWDPSAHTFRAFSTDNYAITIGSGNSSLVSFKYAGATQVGNITTSGSSVAYNTTSDYRVKAGTTPMTGALIRLNLLKPYRGYFTTDPNHTIVDMFFAHEVAEEVPEAVAGAKDAMKTVTTTVNGVTTTTSVPDLQGIDQSKLVPLIVGAVQELAASVTANDNTITGQVTTITTTVTALGAALTALTARVAALESAAHAA